MFRLQSKLSNLILLIIHFQLITQINLITMAAVDNLAVDNMEGVVDNNDPRSMDDVKDTFPSSAFSSSLSSQPLVLLLFSVYVSLPFPVARFYIHFLLQPRTRHTSHQYPHDDNTDLLY